MLGAPQQNLISKTGQLCNTLLETLGDINELDILYNGAGWGTLITDNEIATVPSFEAAGLTSAQVAAAIYVLKQVKVQMETVDLPAIVMLANLG